MYILGSGLAGCIAAIQDESAMILEANAQPNVNHKALLRMRTESISHITGIPFKKVLVHKFILDSDFKFKTWASPKDITLYSRKVIGKLTSRSITSLEPDVRFVPPMSFHQDLLDRISYRTHFGMKVSGITLASVEIEGGVVIDRDSSPIISTIPLTAMLGITNLNVEGLFVSEMESRPIYVSRYRMYDADLHMTVYVTAPNTDVYRVSIHSDVLTIESMSEITSYDVDNITSEIGLGTTEPIEENFRQRIGKIKTINDAVRKEAIYKLTHNLNIYSLGRFACWRSILLDDVVLDLQKIKKMMSKTAYERAIG